MSALLPDVLAARARRARLEQEARAACEARGHLLHGFRPDEWRQTTLSSACCARCGRGVEVNANPRPNEIDVGGEAVAINCKGKGLG